MACGLLAWKDGLREVGELLKATSASGVGAAVLFIPPPTTTTIRISIIVIEVERIQATWSRRGHHLS